MNKVSQDTLNQYLTNYLYAEKMMAEMLSMVMAFAPTEKAKEFIPIWINELATHNAIWERLAKNKTFEPGKMDFNLWKLFEITEGYIQRRNWTGSMTGIALIEHVLNAAAIYLYKHADGHTKLVLKKVVGDFLGHLDFVNQEIARSDEAGYKGEDLRDVQEKFLLEFIDWPIRDETSEADIDILNDAYHLHRIILKRLGVRIPKIFFSRDFQFEIKRSMLKKGLSV